MRRLIILLYLQISLSICTIDIDTSQYVYIADHLTTEECRRLITFLHFMSYDLPVTAAEDIVPKDVPCFKLLIKWNSGGQQWEGRGKTHAELEHRLRQVGRPDIADWLDKAVFQRLANDVNKALEDNPNLTDTESPIINRIFVDKDIIDDDEVWIILDSILWAAVMVLSGAAILTMCRIIYYSLHKNAGKHGDMEEAMDLLSISSGGSGHDLNNENGMDNFSLENAKCNQEDDDDD